MICITVCWEETSGAWEGHEEHEPWCALLWGHKTSNEVNLVLLSPFLSLSLPLSPSLSLSLSLTHSLPICPSLFVQAGRCKRCSLHYWWGASRLGPTCWPGIYHTWHNNFSDCFKEIINCIIALCTLSLSWVSLLETLVLLVRLFCWSTESTSFVRDSTNCYCYQKAIIVVFLCSDEQFLLKRLADTSMDIYAMASVISRYFLAVICSAVEVFHKRKILLNSPFNFVL
jgi:hypothetical protein